MPPLPRRALLAATLTAPLAAAQAEGSFPDRPVRLVVPFPPGQSMDVLPRLLGEALAQHGALRLVVENRPGGVGTIGTEAVVRATPDGYTLGIGSPSTLAVNPTLLPRQPYDVQRDLVPVVRLFNVPVVVVVHPSVPAQDMAELLAWLRANPGTQFASAGPATTPHMTAELFAQRLGLGLQHVPYRGSGPALADLIAGNVKLMFDTAASALPHAEAGRLRILGVTTASRMPGLPAVPTIAETVSPGFDVAAWGGVVAPAGTPAPVLAWLNAACNAGLRDPAVAARFAELGAVPVGGSAADFTAFIRAETATWAEVIRLAHIRLEG